MRTVLAVVLLTLVPGTQAQERADRIFVNGKIWTGEKSRPQAEAMALRGDRLLAVGTNREVRRLSGPGTAVVDLEGRRVVPGFIDSHWHFTASERANLVDSGNVQELQARLRTFAAAHPARDWVAGWGWGYTDFPNRLPEKKYLDQVLPDRPVLVWERDGHMALANSRALELAGVSRATPDPKSGKIERDENGEPTGELKEAAVELVSKLIPPPTGPEYYQALKESMNRAASFGLTSVDNASTGLNADEMQAFERVLGEGDVKLRFYIAEALLTDPGKEQLDRQKQLRETFRGPLLKFGSVKGFLDGTVDARTAAMLEPYVGGGTGIPMMTEEQLKRAVALYDREGFQVMLHAIGDRAIRMALDAYENAARENGTSGRRHRVEHAEAPALVDYPRFEKLGVIASTQALFANPDRTTLENYAVLLGPERASRANAYRLFDVAGARQAFGSDYPVFSMEVLRGIYAAAARKTPEGTPSGGWYPENRITVEAALGHFTRDGAYASFDEREKGTLEAGKLADFVVLSDDILQPPVERVLKTKVLLTVMGGRETYRAGRLQ